MAGFGSQAAAAYDKKIAPSQDEPGSWVLEINGKEMAMSDFKQDAISLLRRMSLEELANYTAEQTAGHWTHQAGITEFTLRQTEWQIRAAEAQVRAAEAEQKAAEAAVENARHSERNAKYMLLSVFAAAASAAISLATTIITVLK